MVISLESAFFTGFKLCNVPNRLLTCAICEAGVDNGGAAREAKSSREATAPV
jgi:hypothetical protein